MSSSSSPAALVYWYPNNLTQAQVDTLTVTAVAVGGTLSAIINQKSVTYTCVTGDTVATAATAWLALINAAINVNPEFGDAVWANPSNGVITATAATAGTPFTLTKSQAGGATATLTHTTPNSSPSDVNAAANWLRNGVQSLPQNGDTMIVADSSVPLLWNLDQLASVTIADYQRWQTFTGSIGLPELNAAGYLEYRPRYFQLASSAGTLTLTLGMGNGSGPSRELYNVGAYRTNLLVLAAGSAADTYSVSFLGTNVFNTIAITSGVSVGVAMLPAEAAYLASATVANGGSLALGVGVVFSGALTLVGSSAVLNCAPSAVNAYAGSSVTVTSAGLTYTSLVGLNGSQFSWLSNSTVTAITLRAGSVFDKSVDPRAMTMTDSAIEGDSCLILDPLNTITFTNGTVVTNRVPSGPFITGQRTFKIT